MLVGDYNWAGHTIGGAEPQQHFQIVIIIVISTMNGEALQEGCSSSAVVLLLNYGETE